MILVITYTPEFSVPFAVAEVENVSRDIRQKSERVLRRFNTLAEAEERAQSMRARQK